MTTPVQSPESTSDRDAILEVVRHTWGFDRLRPLQEEAIRAGLERRDSLVVMPTGGGKSLCYQVPALMQGRTDVVVSPLISLMKDQVDGLVANGYPAAALHSAQHPEERAAAMRFIASGNCRLAFVSPERLVTSAFLETVENLGIDTFAIDEAHCISQWGHDFRPEYRQLEVLKQRIPGVTLHAYTATATERVREDIARQLGLRDAAVLVGRFDRPNLIYRLVPRLDLKAQVKRVLDRHVDEAVIIYCISRKDTEKLATFLKQRGLRAACYHAGLDAELRRDTQEAFTNEQLDVVVATVAFGMGIDRSDVRCVIHAAMPKSIEHYQQETGRAGRDGLAAECVLLHSPVDVMLWRQILERSAAELAAAAAEDFGAADEATVRETDDDPLRAGLRLLDEMRKFCAPGRCRHRSLTEYFGQRYEPPEGATGCGACDVCLGESEGLVDGSREAQMILSCVARVSQRYGVGHVADVLRGADTQRIRSLGHQRLSTWGLMKDRNQKEIMHLAFQLLDQGLLERSNGEYPVVYLNDASLAVMRGEREVQLIPTKVKRARTTRSEAASWEGVDRDLFESLRELRTELARERNVPPYVVFSDASLRDMARNKPSTPDQFLAVHGVGDKKLADFGEVFMERIQEAASDEAPDDAAADDTAPNEAAAEAVP